MTKPTDIPRPKRGRPRAADAGLAEERVLDAATALFLEQGYGRTTIDQVAVHAGTGKSSIYGRFGDKQALFGAVVRQSIDTMFKDAAPPSENSTAEERLRHVGIELGHSLLVPRCVSLMRIIAAEAGTMPELAETAYQISYEGSVERISDALDGVGFPSDLPRSIAARRFLELALQPLSFQAAFGASIDQLRTRIAHDVEDAVTLLKARGVRFDNIVSG